MGLTFKNKDKKVVPPINPISNKIVPYLATSNKQTRNWEN